VPIKRGSRVVLMVNRYVFQGLSGVVFVLSSILLVVPTWLR